MLMSPLHDITEIGFVAEHVAKSGNPEEWIGYKKSHNKKVTVMTCSAKQQYLSVLAWNLSHKFRRNHESAFPKYCS